MDANEQENQNLGGPILLYELKSKQFDKILHLICSSQ